MNYQLNFTSKMKLISFKISKGVILLAKRNTSWTEEKIAKYEKEGRGKGELKNYKPWLTIQDVPSMGRSHRFKGWKTGRQHHLLSDLEKNYLLLLDWAEDVIDIREQFPLNREYTLKIAGEKDITHSINRENGVPIVMTTDFLITIRKNDEFKYLARTTKYSKDLNDKRKIELFEIEKQYWEENGVDFRIVTEMDIPEAFVNNLKFFHKSYYDEYEDTYIKIMIEQLAESSGRLIDFLKKFNDKYLNESGEAISLFKHLVARKYVLLDMNTKYSASKIDITQLRVIEKSIREHD